MQTNSFLFVRTSQWSFGWILGILAVAALSSFATAQQPHVFPGAQWEQTTDPQSVGYDPEKLQAVRERLQQLDTTGMMVVVGGRVLFEYGDLKQLSYLASVRKSVLAMLYGKYVETGVIDLDKSLAELDIDDEGGLSPGEKEATIRHLITARSGVYHPASNGGDSTASAPPRGSKKAGEYFLYNNWDFNAAGAIFEKLTDKDIYDALQNDLAIPIGMQDFKRSAQRKGGNAKQSRYLAYHMWLSTRDMARIGYLMLREGNWAGKQVIPRDWTREIVSLVTPIKEMNPRQYRRGFFGYGYMWWIWDGPRAGEVYQGAYTGMGAFGQFITVLPKLDMVIAHKTNPRGDGGRNARVSIAEYRKVVAMVIQARTQN